MKLLRVSFLLGCFLATACLARAGELKVFPLFTDHGILQQDTTVPVWGTASPGAVIAVTFRDSKATATTDSSGKWLARLQTPKAEPGKDDGYDLTISSTDGQIVLHDVVAGEVWIGSGQSNIDTPMNNYPVGKAEAPKADIPGIRLYSAGFVGNGIAVTADFSKFQWTRCNPETVLKASATGYFFSRELHKALNVPVGFINMAVGASPLSTWLLPDWLASDPRMATNFQTFKTTGFPAFIADSKDRLAKWETATAEAKAKGQRPPGRPFIFPGNTDQPLEKFVGAFHLTHTAVVIPFVFKGMLWDQGESGVGYGLKGEYDLVFDVMVKNLRREFGYELPVVYCQMPKGGAWGPTVRVAKNNYAVPELGDPVPLADLPPDAPKAGSVFDSFAKEPDAFLRMNALPSCYMATTRDLQTAIHPPDKDEYGTRFCLTALNKVYGRDTEFFGPMITSAKRDGNQIRLKFDHAGTGLAALGGKPVQGFYATGADGKSLWVQSRIECNEVILSGTGLDSAVTVSYAHSNGGRVLWANLFNREGLPAYPMTVKVQ